MTAETYKNWHGVPFTYLNDPRRVGLSQSAFGTLIDLYLLAHRDLKLREDSHRWESRQHLAVARAVDDDDLDALVHVGFVEEDADGIRLPDDEFVWQATHARAIPGEAEKKREQRAAKAEAGNSRHMTTNGAAKPEGLLRQTLREQLGAMALSEPGTQAMARLDGLEPQHVLESARAFTNGVGGPGIVSGDYLAENVAKNLKRGQAVGA